MKKNIIINKKDGTAVKAEIKKLNKYYLDKVFNLDREVYKGLENKEFYFCSSREEFEDSLSGNGQVIGCVIPETDELIAMGVYKTYGYNEHNYGYDFNIKGKELLKVGQIESTVVHPKYRGNGLQLLICRIIEDIARENGNSMISATAAPDNKYSVNTFLKLGYEVMADKIKYGGLRRYVLMKKIDNR